MMKVHEVLRACKPTYINNADYENADFDSRVSVIIPITVDVNLDLFTKCLDSILNQSFSSFEVLLVDDATDGLLTESIDDYIKKDVRIRCIRNQKSIGITAILEYEAVRESKGEFFAFISPTVEWEINYLEKTLEFLERKQGKACFGIVKYRRRSKKHTIDLGKVENWTKGNNLALLNPIAKSGVVIARSVIWDKRVGLFDPHLIHRSYGDWSLWKRIKQYYVFYETDILCGYEIPTLLKSKKSLTHISDYNVLERDVEARNISFVPEDYEQIDIAEYSKFASGFYKSEIKKVFNDYVKLHSYIDCNTNESETVTEEGIGRKKIAIIGPFNATVGLNFERYALNSDRYVVSFLGMVADIEMILQSDAAICIRASSYGGIDYHKLCKEYEIPCYYYTDDNFVELNKQFPSNEEFYRLTKQMRNGWLKEFCGILVSTNPLRDFLVKEKLIEPEKIITFPCVVSERIIPEINDNDALTVAFLGGKARVEHFVKHYMPYLKEYAKTKEVRFVCVADDELKDMDVGDVKVKYFERTEDIEVLLNEVAEFKPNLLVHFGEEGPNSKYKTINAMWNALSIGAVLVVNKIEPYNKDELTDCCFQIDDGKQLKDIFEIAINDKDCLREKYANAYKLCKQTYGFLNADNAIKDFINLENSVSDYAITRRLLDYYCDFKLGKKNIRPIYSDALCFAGPILWKSVYYVTCTKDSVDKIGMCFAKCSAKDAIGNVKVVVQDKSGYEICSETRALSEIEWNNWTYFDFNRTYDENMRTKSFKVSIYCSYEKGSSKVGVFEQTDRKYGIYIIRKLFGIPAFKLNVLFADC